ncbi:MAG: 50S ribosomal protein L33 [Candidatus Krumholzibacteriota bacterium]|nr:50S ribosomal protein L33 [Candidatus Krumholzibacteriota bacterium]
MRQKVTMACTKCKNRNYQTTKNRRLHPDRLEQKKYCRFCGKHTLHKQTR